MSNLRFPCQQCKKECSDPTKRVPGHVALGRVILEQYVCASCHDNCVASLAKHHDGANRSDPSRCNRCGDAEFKGVGPYYAHHHPVGDGSWVTMPVCKDCFTPYHELCKSNARRGK